MSNIKDWLKSLRRRTFGLLEIENLIDEKNAKLHTSIETSAF